MKNKLTVMLGVTILLIAANRHYAKAQTSWLLKGNVLKGGEKLGSQNNFPVTIFTNGIERMRFKETGNITIGLSTGPTRFMEFNLRSSMKFSIDQYVFRHSLSGEGLFYNNTAHRIEYRDQLGEPNMWFEWLPGRAYFRKNVGIGTTEPESNLHVFRGSAGTVTAIPNAPFVVENSTNNYINVLSPGGSERGIVFGDNSDPADAGIVVLGQTKEMQFRTNGNVARMILTADGNLSVGTLDPDPFRVKISHNNFGLDIENAATSDDWELLTNTNSSLSLFCNGNFRGSFNCTNGAYSSVSDARLKTGIQPMQSVLEKINQLKPSTYQFKTGSRQEMGFIAQDLLKIFPSLVTHNMDKSRNLDVYTLNYSGFGVIAIKGIQELQQIIEEQKKTAEEQRGIINMLQDRLNKLEAALGITNSTNAVTESAKTNVVITNARLEQNKPNPFTNTTSIQYNIPTGSKNAQLIITDNSGKVVKNVTLNAGSGVVNVDASALISGSYNYTLSVNGKLLESKKMIVTR